MALSGWAVRYPPELHSVNLDAEWLYRKLFPKTLQTFHNIVVRPLDQALRRGAVGSVNKILRTLNRHHGPQGILERTWPTGSMVLWVAVLLGFYLIVYSL